MNVLDSHWASRLVNLAREVAGWSKDRYTQVGAVITTVAGRPVSWGFNGFPVGVDDDVDSRHQRPDKYRWTAHAEQNALDLAPGPVAGGVLFVTLSPCTGCARSIIQRGISTVVVARDGTIESAPEHWREDMTIARDMMIEAGVTYRVEGTAHGS